MCGKETFIAEVEVLREEMRETEVVVEGEFATEAQMAEWGFSEYFGETISICPSYLTCLGLLIIYIY